MRARTGSTCEVAFIGTVSLLFSGCVATELSVPVNHPGNPNARSGRLETSAGWRSNFDAGNDSAEQTETHPQHRHGETPVPKKEGK
jgi:hypothetical protein